jgi:flagellar motor switch protein FliN/FliY
MDHQNQLKAARTFASSFAGSLAETLTQRLGSPWLLVITDDPHNVNLPEPVVHFRLSASGGLQGDCFVTLEQEDVCALGSKLLERPIAEFNEELGEEVAEVIASAMEGLSSSLTTQFGMVAFRVDRVEDAHLKEMLVVAMSASGVEGVEVPVLLYVSEQFLGSMSTPGGGKTSTKAKKSAIDPANLQLVMDVELSVSLRFGQCQLPLRDVLDLASGSVIELDRDVDDPVELLLDGKVIARGEAVIVDGNYGLRITEIPEPLSSHFIS